MDDYPSNVNTRVQDDTLDYALLGNLAVTITLTVLTYTQLETSLIIPGLTLLFGMIWTFTITPYIIATWLNTPIETLLTRRQFYHN